jgi:hypothetical protein
MAHFAPAALFRTGFGATLTSYFDLHSSMEYTVATVYYVAIEVPRHDLTSFSFADEFCSANLSGWTEERPNSEDQCRHHLSKAVWTT